MSTNITNMAFDSVAPMLAQWGINLPGGQFWLEDPWRTNEELAYDAQPSLLSSPNASIPSFLTTIVDPKIIEILQAPSKIATIFGEAKKGDWLMDDVIFPVVESTGEVSSYGDRSNNGRAGANTEFENRQSYLYQTIVEWGERELARMALAKIGWAATVRASGVKLLNKYQNLTYAFGVSGLQCYGILNDPSLGAYLTPATKAAGGVAWVSGGRIVATANEVYNDIQSMFVQLATQTGGLVSVDQKMTLVLSNVIMVALTAANSFNVNVRALLKENFPNLRIIDAVQYGVVSAQNTQGIAGGNVVQLIADELDGNDTGISAFNEKLRSHPIFVDRSSFSQKLTQGTWGTVIFYPVAIAQMQGV